MFKIIVILILFLLNGCSVLKKKPLTIIEDEPTFKLMYVKINQEPFIKSEQVKVFNVINGIANTSKGQLSILKLEDKRSEFKLYVNTPNGKRVRILNIKPKYKDGIWLKEGKYYIEVSAKQHNTYKKWINLHKDTNLTIELQQQKNTSVGTIIWDSHVGIKYINGLYWQDQAANKNNKMNWYAANKYCQDLVIKDGKIDIDDFELPTEAELFSLHTSNSKLDYSKNICWSSSSDDKHINFAKYVYINAQKSAWYSKEGNTYVRCVSRRNYPTNLSLFKLTKVLQKEKKYKFLDALESCLKIKYGEPIIQNVIYNSREKSLSFTLRSQKYDSNKKYFYNNKHTVPMKFHPKSLKFKPKIIFNVINDELVFKDITNCYK